MNTQATDITNNPSVFNIVNAELIMPERTDPKVTNLFEEIPRIETNISSLSINYTYEIESALSFFKFKDTIQGEYKSSDEALFAAKRMTFYRSILLPNTMRSFFDLTFGTSGLEYNNASEKYLKVTLAETYDSFLELRNRVSFIEDCLSLLGSRAAGTYGETTLNNKGQELTHVIASYLVPFLNNTLEEPAMQIGSVTFLCKQHEDKKQNSLYTCFSLFSEHNIQSTNYQVKTILNRG